MSFLRSPAHALPHRHGMTLPEVMITLAIMGILLAMALPSMRAFVIQNRLAAETRLFIAALTLARNEAIKRGRAVLVCRSVAADAVGAQCSSAASGDRAGKDWSAGWLVLVADNRQILWRQRALDTHTQAPAGRTTITYNGSGNASASFTSLLFSHHDEFARRICIANSGRVTVKSDGSEC
jgi:type IV fimbrial biogenesis protein FimT